MTTQQLQRAGFDRSEFDRSTRTWHVQCSQCEALVINGVACHERGCPNTPRGNILRGRAAEASG